MRDAGFRASSARAHREGFAHTRTRTPHHVRDRVVSARNERSASWHSGCTGGTAMLRIIRLTVITGLTFILSAHDARAAERLCDSSMENCRTQLLNLIG